MTESRNSTATFPPEGSSVPAARELVRATLLGWRFPAERTEDAVLVASELMTNAVVHAGTEIELTCVLAEPPGGVRIEVRDLLPMRPVGEPGSGPAREGGRGLLVTQALTDSWGVTYTKTAKVVWFELGVPAPSPVPVAPPAPLDAPPGLPPGRLYDHVIQWVLATVGADAAHVMVAGGDDALERRASAGSGAPEGLDEEAALLAGAARGHDGVLPRAHGRFRSVVAVPLTSGAARHGLMVAAAEAPGRFGAGELARLRHAAAFLAPSVAGDRQDAARQGYRGWLGFLAEAGELLAGALDEEVVLALAAQLFVPRVADWCAVYVDRRPDGGDPANLWHRDERRITALRRVLAGAPVPARDRVAGTGPWGGLGTLTGPDRLTCGTAVLEVPLAIRGERFGVLLLGGPDGGPFRSDAVRLAEDLATRVALALLTARRYGEQAAASQILQRALLPARLPRVPGLDVDVLYAPAGEGAAAGGDFYDLFAAGPGRWRFMLGDVCGTGPEAAAVTSVARHTLRALAREGLSAASALDRLNETILDDGAARLLTIVHGELARLGGGRMRMSVVCAGHPLPLRLAPDGAVTAVGTSQLLLGAVPDPSYELDTVVLDRGDVVLCVTDGITERRHGERQLDDDDGLARLLAGCAGLGARAVSARVHRTVRDFTPRPLDDDVAILTLRLE